MVLIRLPALKMKGYTLIELLVTITIVVLVSGLSLSGYLIYNESRLLDIDAKNLNSELGKIRSKAVFLEYPSLCTGLTSYAVSSDLDIDGQRKNIKYTANCNSGTLEPVVVSLLKSSVFLADFSLVFVAQTGYLDPNENVDILIRSEKGNQKTMKVTVNKLVSSLNVSTNEE